MTDKQVAWTWRGGTVQLGLDEIGQGPTVLCLPALSSISTRREMRPLQDRLSGRYRTVSIDWPGFGDLPRPQLDWTPETYSEFLAFVLGAVVPAPHAVIAAGHAATYAIAHGCAHPKSFGRLVLVAPTWRGPLPTMMNGRRAFFDRICDMVDRPLLGPALYRLNVNRMVVRSMAAGHVYSDPAWLRGKRLREKLTVTRASGSRFASVRFVTGALDPVSNRYEFLELARRAEFPMFAVFGRETPPRSCAEMEALAAVRDMRSACLPRGKTVAA